MAGPALRQQGEGRYLLSGELNFATVPEAWEALQAVIRQVPVLRLSLDRVEQANSAALALLLEAVALARACSHRLILEGLPANLLELAAMSNVETLLTTGGEDGGLPPAAGDQARSAAG